MPAFIVSASQAHHRWDVAYHRAAKTHAVRTRTLSETMAPAQAQTAIRAFPEILVLDACAVLARGGGRVKPDQAISAALKEPFLAMALIEQAIPSHLERLDAQAAEVQRQRENLLQQAAVFGDAPRTKALRV